MDDEPIGCFVIMGMMVAIMALMLVNQITDPEAIAYNEAYQVYQDTRDYTASLNPNDREGSCENLARNIESFRSFDDDRLEYMWNEYQEICDD